MRSPSAPAGGSRASAGALHGLATATLIAVMLAATSLMRAPGPRQITAGAVHAPDAVGPGPLAWLAIGATGGPADTQVSIEADVALATRSLRGSGATLFAGGSGARCVQVADRSRSGDVLLRELGALFNPRSGRNARYRYPTLRAHAATDAQVRFRLQRQLRFATHDPLLVFIAGHGEAASAAPDNRVALWAGGALTARDLAVLMDAPTAVRPALFVMTTCFSGGFAELAFRAADVAKGPAAGGRCGLFAATWDLESTGCDADPDRRLHHGYATYFFAALRRVSRDGKPLAASDIDFDGDGVVSALEAHTRVRIASPTADVPTTTSERWLRAVAPLSGAASPVEMAEDRAVIAALGLKLGIADPAADAERAFTNAQKAADGVRETIDELQGREDAAWHVVAAALQARWPILDDPWHPDFAALWASERGAIEAFMASSSFWASYKLAAAATDKAAARQAVVDRRRAQHERLARAVQTVKLAGHLASTRDEDWLYWRQLLRCERFVPALRTPPPQVTSRDTP